MAVAQLAAAIFRRRRPFFGRWLWYLAHDFKHQARQAVGRARYVGAMLRRACGQWLHYLAEEEKCARVRAFAFSRYSRVGLRRGCGRWLSSLAEAAKLTDLEVGATRRLQRWALRAACERWLRSLSSDEKCGDVAAHVRMRHEQSARAVAFEAWCAHGQRRRHCTPLWRERQLRLAWPRLQQWAGASSALEAVGVEACRQGRLRVVERGWELWRLDTARTAMATARRVLLGRRSCRWACTRALRLWQADRRRLGLECRRAYDAALHCHARALSAGLRHLRSAHADACRRSRLFDEGADGVAGMSARLQQWRRWADARARRGAHATCVRRALRGGRARRFLTRWGEMALSSKARHASAAQAVWAFLHRRLLVWRTHAAAQCEIDCCAAAARQTCVHSALRASLWTWWAWWTAEEADWTAAAVHAAVEEVVEALEVFEGSETMARTDEECRNIAQAAVEATEAVVATGMKLAGTRAAEDAVVVAASSAVTLPSAGSPAVMVAASSAHSGERAGVTAACQSHPPGSCTCWAVTPAGRVGGGADAASREVVAPTGWSPAEIRQKMREHPLPSPFDGKLRAVRMALGEPAEEPTAGMSLTAGTKLAAPAAAPAAIARSDELGTAEISPSDEHGTVAAGAVVQGPRAAQTPQSRLSFASTAQSGTPQLPSPSPMTKMAVAEVAAQLLAPSPSPMAKQVMKEMLSNPNPNP